MSASIDILPLPEVLIEIGKNISLTEFGIVSLFRKTGYFRRQIAVVLSYTY
jgi:hypothetical protein